MTEALPISIPYNLNRLGQSGDQVVFAADPGQRAALALDAGILDVPKFDARVLLQKISPTHFKLSYDVSAEVMQACVVTLAPLLARITREFERELILMPQLRRGPVKEVVISAEGDDAPEEIDSPHFDLAGPLLEEFLLALDPYPRAPGVEFTPPEGMNQKPESPFAVLKGLKSGE